MIQIIVNLEADNGRGLKTWRKVEKYLSMEQIDYDIELAETRAEVEACAAEFTSKLEEPTTLIMVGDDDNFNAMLNGINVTEYLTIGYIPVNSDSIISRSLKLPHSASKGIKNVILQKTAKKYSYGVITFGDTEVHHQRFLIFAGAVSSKKNGIDCSKGHILIDDVRKVEFARVFQAGVRIDEASKQLFKPKHEEDLRSLPLALSVINHPSMVPEFSLFNRSPYPDYKQQPGGSRNYRCREMSLRTEKGLAVVADGRFFGTTKQIEIHMVNCKIRIAI